MRIAQLKPYGGFLSALGALGALAWLAYYVHPSPLVPDYPLTLLIGTTGIVIGWLIGFLTSPYNASEKQRFATLATAVSAFFSGYVVSKIDPTITDLFSPDRFARGGPVLLTRVLGFVCCVIVGSIASYSYREYLGRPDPSTRT